MSTEDIRIFPIMMHPNAYQMTLTTSPQAILATSWLTPPPEMPLYRGRPPDPIRKEYLEVLKSWREKRYYQEIYFILRYWKGNQRGLFHHQLGEADIGYLEDLKTLPYDDHNQIELLTGSKVNDMFTGLHYEEAIERQEASMWDNKQSEKEKSYEERRREAVKGKRRADDTKIEHPAKRLTMSLGDERSILNARDVTPGSPESTLPPGVSNMEARMFARDRYSMWALPLPNGGTQMHESLGLPDILRSAWDHKPIDWTKPEFNRLLPGYIIERGRREVERGYRWGIPYHALEATARRVKDFAIDQLYLRSARRLLLRIEHWYLEKSDEEARQLDPNDLLQWDIPKPDQLMLESFIRVHGGILSPN